MKKNAKYWMNKLHLWLGLVTAPLVFFVCITGTIIVFSDEIIELSAGKAKYVNNIKDHKLETEELIKKFKDQFPNRRQPSYMVCYRDPNRSVRFNSFSKTEGLRMVYMDPYTGKVLKDDSTIYFFYITAHLHHSLLLHKTGTWIIDITTIIFVIALISGLILWWPRSWQKKYKKASFSIKTNASKSRLNLDLHKVLGFYCLGLLLLLSLTGLLIAFKPLSSVTQNAFGGNPELQMKNVFAKSSSDTNTKTFPINLTIDKAFKTYPDKDEIQFYTYWLNDWDYYVMNIAKKIGIKSAMNVELIAFNKYSGSQFVMPNEFKINKKVENAYWSLHMGNYMGLFGKIITFIAGLIGSSLPITGFIIWLQKRNK